MSVWDDEAGYDYDDPKHPTFHERYADWGDTLRKRDKESDPPCSDPRPDPRTHPEFWTE